MSKLPVQLKDTAVFFCWIGGIFIIAGLCWFLTKPLRADLLRQTVNRAWAESGESFRLREPIAPGTMKPGLSRLGSWYSVDDENRALVFTLIADGIFLPCTAIVDSNGKVQNIMPLIGNGEKFMNRISPGIKQLYIRRIEGRP